MIHNLNISGNLTPVDYLSATTILNDILAEIQVTDEEIENAIEKHSELREFLEKEFNAQSYLSGSYKKNTGIKPLNDVDIILWIPKSESGYDTLKDIENNLNPEKHLKKIKRRMKNSDVDHEQMKIQSHSIGIYYPDEKFSLDVIPSFAAKDPNEDTGFNRRFIIPEKPTEKWIGTNPDKSILLLKIANEKANKKLKPIIKLLKRKKHCLGTQPYKFLKSFHIETILMYISKTEKSIFNQGRQLFNVFFECVEKILEIVESNTNISSKLDLDANPANYLTEEPKRKAHCIRKLKKLISDLDMIENLDDENQINEELRDQFCLDDDELNVFTGVSKTARSQKFG